ncbi:hypothetical protein PAPHI01_2414 [Pancytospora philotis]|nr:hypothetical protein PAPHI01_2414 [Pancytospora philotis]
MLVRARQFSKLFILTEAFVSAKLSITSIKEALEKEYGSGEYVDPEGPLNIMRGHSSVNDGMIAKQRKFAAPMRLGYSCTGDASEADCTYTRNTREDGVRTLPADSEAMVYLSEHYRILKSMFTIENNAVVVDKSPAAPFWSMLGIAPNDCEELFAALLVLAGGGDIRLDRGSVCDYYLFTYDAVDFMRLNLVDLEHANYDTLEVVAFFIKYGGTKASQVAGYGLHYTDSPSFLIQAYICACIESSDALARIFRAARKIAARLRADNSGLQPGLHFFTNNEDCVRAYVAKYDALALAENDFNSPHRVLRWEWPAFRNDNYSDGEDSTNIVSTLLRLHYCFPPCASPEDRGTGSSADPKNELLDALVSLFNQTSSVSENLGRTGLIPKDDYEWEMSNAEFENFLAAFRAQAPASRTIMDCCSGSNSAGIAADPKDFLLVLAWVLGEPEDGLRSLQQLLQEALGDAGSAFHCQQISNRVAQMLGQFSGKTIEAHFGVSIAPDGTRLGSLWLASQNSDETETAGNDYAMMLAFKPEKVEIMYVRATSNDLMHGGFNSTLEGLDIQPAPLLPASVREEADKRNNFTLHALIRASIERYSYPAAHRARGDRYIEEMCAAKDPLAAHIAISHWMARQPMQSQLEVVVAGDRLPLVLERLLTRSTDGNDTARFGLTPDSPVVAVMDNILGNTLLSDDSTLRELCAGGLRRCASNRPDLFPRMSLFTDRYLHNTQKWNESAYDCFLACLAGYGIPETLLRYVELRAHDKVQAASSVPGPWSSDVCAAVARCFKLRYDIVNHGSGGATFNACHYRRAMDDLKRAANGAALSAQDLWSNNLCTAAERCFKLGGGGSALGLHGDTRDVCYYRYSICALLAAAANPAEYCAMLRSICGRWDDTLGVFRVYLLLQMAFPKLPTPRPISLEFVADVFSSEPSPEQIKSLLRVFAVFAFKSRDYLGICEVFHEYRALLSPEYAREYVEALKSRHNAYSYAPRKIFDDLCVPVDEFSAPPFAALEDLLEDCLKDVFDVKTLPQRVEELPQMLHLCARRPAAVRGAAR